MTSVKLSVAQVLGQSVPKGWADTSHGRRSLARVNSFVGWAGMDKLLGADASGIVVYPGRVRPTVFDLRADVVFSRSELANWLNVLDRNTNLSAGSRNRHLSSVLTVWRRAHNLGLLPEPPSGLYEREGRGRRRTLTTDEERRLFDALGDPYRALAAFLGLTGLRVSEALSLTWADVEAPAVGMARIHVMDSKNGDPRVVPVRVDLLKLALPSLSDGDRGVSAGIARAGPFTHVSQSAFNHAWSAARAALGLASDDEFVPHALRHTYATRLVVAGVPLSVVAKLLGHRTVRTTMRYSHVSDQDSERWIEKVS